MTFFPGFSAELIETSGTTIHVLREGVGPPVAIVTMLDFASPHNITPQNEHFPMSAINEAFADSNQARPIRVCRAAEPY